jgi:hypothetical protein
LVAGKNDSGRQGVQNVLKNDIFVHDEKKTFLKYETNNFFDLIGISLLRCYVENKTISVFLSPNTSKILFMRRQGRTRLGMEVKC